jgi:hypothetical protein
VEASGRVAAHGPQTKKRLAEGTPVVAVPLLRGSHGVDMVFNGHAHIYERNHRSAPGMPVSYVTGGGGADLEPVSNCSPIDAYAIGWSASASTHGSACGAATRPTSIDQVFNFLLVRVDGTTVRVEPTNANGNPFDVQTYHFG